MMTLSDKVSFLNEVSFFHGMTPDQLEALARISNEVKFAEGQIICKEGELGDTLFMIIRGQVALQHEVRLRRQTSITRLATLGEREFFAETVIFDEEPHLADVVALEDTELLALHKDHLVNLIRVEPDLAFGLFKVLGRRLRQTNQALIEKTPSRPKKLMDLYDKFPE